jgi:hypothetical protein
MAGLSKKEQFSIFLPKGFEITNCLDGRKLRHQPAILEQFSKFSLKDQKVETRGRPLGRKNKTEKPLNFFVNQNEDAAKCWQHIFNLLKFRPYLTNAQKEQIKNNIPKVTSISNVECFSADCPTPQVPVLNVNCSNNSGICSIAA